MSLLKCQHSKVKFMLINQNSTAQRFYFAITPTPFIELPFSKGKDIDLYLEMMRMDNYQN